MRTIYRRRGRMSIRERIHAAPDAVSSRSNDNEELA
jgi:hypothetical protein